MKSDDELKLLALKTVQGAFDGWYCTKPKGPVESWLVNLADYLIADTVEALALVQDEAMNAKSPSKRQCLEAAGKFVKADHCKAAFYKGARWAFDYMKKATAQGINK